MRRCTNSWHKFVLLLGLTTAFGTPVSGYQPVNAWSYFAYQTTSGLPDNSITGITQTSDGYLWVATRAGLVRFNGKTFTTLSPKNLPPLPSRAVRGLLRDRRDRLWVAIQRSPLFCLTPDGLERFSVVEGSLGVPLQMMAEDKSGAVWLVYPYEVRRISNGKVESIPTPNDAPLMTSPVAASDSQGNLWRASGRLLAVWRDDKWQSEIRFDHAITAIGTGTGVASNLWVGAGNRIFAYAESNAPVELGALPGYAVPKVLLADKSGALWVGTATHGLFHWTGKHFEQVTTSQSEITCLFEDREANLWAGTEGGGLNLIRPRTTALVNRDAGLPFDSVVSVAEDASGNLWAVSQDSKLAMGKEGQWKLITIMTNGLDVSATCVATDSKGGVWTGTLRHGLWAYQSGTWRNWSKTNGLASVAIRSILAAANGDIWVASSAPDSLHRLRDGQLQAMENNAKLGRIRALAEGADGTVWIGTSEGRIQRVAGDKLVTESAISQSELISVRSLLATSDGSLWIGYAGDGLGLFKDGKYVRLTTADGLADDFISQILADDHGYLWLNGNRGLSRIKIADVDMVFTGKTQRVKAQSFGKNDGLPAFQPARDIFPCAARGRDGHLWFSTHSGLVVARPDNITDNLLPPPVRLEQVTVDEQLVAIYEAGSPLQTQSATNAVNLRGLAKPLRLAPGHRKLDIEFAALSFTAAEDVQFRYRLTGFDEDWVEAGDMHHAIYPRLVAGSYEFQVIACNNSGVWNEAGQTLHIVVTPFLWETWWFRLGVGLIMVALVAGSAYAVSRQRYRLKIRQLEAKRTLEQERARIAKDIHDDLGANLTRIILLSKNASPATKGAETSAADLVKIHETARELTRSVGEVVWAVNPEHDTYDSLSNYLGLYAQKFLQAAGIRCRINMPMQMPPQPLSADIRHNLFLAFKEALNNAVKYAEASEVRVALTLHDTGFELLVADNGKGFRRESPASPANGNELLRALPGNGLANMQSRLQDIGGECEVQSELGCGTTVIFRVKLGAQQARH